MNRPATIFRGFALRASGAFPRALTNAGAVFNGRIFRPLITEEPAPEHAPARSGPPASLLLILGAAIGLGIAVYIVRSQKDLPAEAAPAAIALAATAADGDQRRTRDAGVEHIRGAGDREHRAHAPVEYASRHGRCVAGVGINRRRGQRRASCRCVDRSRQCARHRFLRASRHGGDQ